jgi:hypothetical protein
MHAGAVGSPQQMHLVPPEPLSEPDSKLAAMQRWSCRACGGPLCPATTGAAPPSQPGLLARAAIFVGAAHAPPPPFGRRCHFDGWLYCPECHSDKTAAIPSSVLESWDFQKLPVCDNAAEFLAGTSAQPLLAIDAASTALFAAIPLLGMLHASRARIVELLSVVRDHTGGKEATEVQVRLQAALRRIGHRRYLLETSDRWSMDDLCDVVRGAAFAQLPGWLERQEEWLRGLVTATVSTPVQHGKVIDDAGSCELDVVE